MSFLKFAGIFIAVAIVLPVVMCLVGWWANFVDNKMLELRRKLRRH